jgi:hypothetical protein
MLKEDSKRYRGSYAFAEESLLPGGTSPILSAFDDLESVSELFATADPPVTAPAAAAKPVANTAKPVANSTHKTPNLGGDPRG